MTYGWGRESFERKLAFHFCVVSQGATGQTEDQPVEWVAYMALVVDSASWTSSSICAHRSD